MSHTSHVHNLGRVCAQGLLNHPVERSNWNDVRINTETFALLPNDDVQTDMSHTCLLSVTRNVRLNILLHVKF
jgi:hypothetical protein